MLKQRRWADWPQPIRWLTGGAVVVLLIVAAAWLLFVAAADWLAHQDVGAAGGPLLQTARDAARGRLLTLGAGVLAAGALAFTARNFTLSREGQVTDRYSKAITQLGDQKPDVRIGGIYALERVASDSARDHPTVMEVLAAFVREHSTERPVPAGNSDLAPERLPQPRPDVQAALTVIARRNTKRDIRRVDLTGAIIRGAKLGGAKLTDAELAGADLNHADLTDADLAGAKLTGAKLTRADLNRADLNHADLNHADLTGADLNHADLTGADLNHADLTGAYLGDAKLNYAHLGHAKLNHAKLGEDPTSLNPGADLRHADLRDADLSHAYLARAYLTGADLGDAKLTDAELARADLSDARWPHDVRVPQGWQIDDATGRLIRQL